MKGGNWEEGRQAGGEGLKHWHHTALQEAAVVFASTVHSEFSPSMYFLIHQHANEIDNINKPQGSSFPLPMTRDV